MFCLTFFLHKISQLCFYYRDFIKIVRQRLVAASTHELKNGSSSGGWLSGCNSACIRTTSVQGEVNPTGRQSNMDIEKRNRPIT